MALRQASDLDDSANSLYSSNLNSYIGEPILNEIKNNENRFQILILPGGGYRGLFTAQILADIERETGKLIGEHFDLISGTSIGGILALAISYGVPAQQMVDLFVKHGDEIFKPRRSFAKILRSPFTSDALKKMLFDIFQSDTLGSLQRRVIIPAINYSSGKPVVFKTSHHPDFKRDHTHSIVDVALATSAAPTFFPRHSFNNQQYVDGGLYANFPGLLALHEAEYFLERNVNDIHMLVIGTMSSKYTVDPSQLRNGGLLDWGRAKSFLQFWKFKDAATSIVELGISVQESLSHYMLAHKLGGRITVLDEEQNKFSSEAVGLAKVDVFSQEVLMGAAHEKSKYFIGSSKFNELIEHSAPAPIFFHK